MSSKNQNQTTLIEAAAEQWVNLILIHITNERLKNINRANKKESNKNE